VELEVLACGVVCGNRDGENWEEAARRRGAEHSVWLTHGRRRRNISGIITDGSREMRGGGKQRKRRGMQAVAWLVAIAAYITVVETQTNSTTTTTTTPALSAKNSSNTTNATLSVVIIKTTPAPT